MPGHRAESAAAGPPDEPGGNIVRAWLRPLQHMGPTLFGLAICAIFWLPRSGAGPERAVPVRVEAARSAIQSSSDPAEFDSSPGRPLANATVGQVTDAPSVPLRASFDQSRNESTAVADESRPSAMPAVSLAERTGSQPAGTAAAAREPARATAAGIRALAAMADQADSVPGRPAGGLRTEERATRFFGLTARNVQVVAYVIDCSGSMGAPPRKLMLAKEELIRSIDDLQPSQYFYVAFFSHDLFAMPGGQALAATDENKARVRDWFDGVYPAGGTNPLPALLHVLRLQPDTIYVLSDGLFRSDYVRAVRSHNGGLRRSAIYTVNFGDRRGERQLLRLARENDGQYRHFAAEN